MLTKKRILFLFLGYLIVSLIIGTVYYIDTFDFAYSYGLSLVCGAITYFVGLLATFLYSLCNTKLKKVMFFVIPLICFGVPALIFWRLTNTVHGWDALGYAMLFIMTIYIWGSFYVPCLVNNLLFKIVSSCKRKEIQ